MTNIKLIELDEHGTSDHLSLTADETQILQTRFRNELDVVYNPDGTQSIKARQFIGYIVLPNHIISIEPKIPEASFINMIRYALKLPKLTTEIFFVSEEAQKYKNYYDILVKFLLHLVEPL